MIPLSRLSKALLILAVSLAVAGCGDDARVNPATADTTYGAAVDATDATLVRALAAPAVAAEDSLYLGRRVTVDGRITAIRASGCEVHLNTDETPLVVTSPRTDVEDCAWQVPEDTQGFAVAAGTLRTAVDTLRLTANGVRVTPVRISSPDS
jgi:hypothetical protein